MNAAPAAEPATNLAANRARLTGGSGLDTPAAGDVPAARFALGSLAGLVFVPIGAALALRGRLARR